MISTRTLIFAGVAAALSPGIANAQSDMNKGYLTDTSGRIVMSGSGLCWQHRDIDNPFATGPCVPGPTPVAAVAPAPRPAAVIAAAPPPAPAAPRAAAPARPLPQKFSFSGDALFAFDKSELKPEGKTMLDGLVRQLDGVTYEEILATGHTDRFGSNAYNQKLSERRAHTVKDYLVGKNVQAGRIDAEGKGETQHVTNAGDCPGAKATTKVKACLQPDRRVDVEVKGGKTITGSR